MESVGRGREALKRSYPNKDHCVVLGLIEANLFRVNHLVQGWAINNDYANSITKHSPMDLSIFLKQNTTYLI